MYHVRAHCKSCPVLTRANYPKVKGNREYRATTYRNAFIISRHARRSRAEYIYRYFIMVAGGASVAYHRGVLRKKSLDLVPRAENVLTVLRLWLR